MPVRVEEAVRLMPIVRMSANGQRAAILLLNAGMDKIREATVHIRTPIARVRLLTPGAKDRVIPLKRQKVGGVLTLRGIEPCSFQVILIGK